MALEGKLVRLRERRPADMEFLTDLRNDLETQAWSKTLPPDYTVEMHRKDYESREFSYDRYDGRFMIELRKTGEVVGMVSYTDLRPRLAATIGVGVAKPYWGKGVAQDASEVLLKFLFVELGLRAVRLWTHSGNTHAVQLAQRVGFKIAVRQREAIFKSGELYDNLLMDMLREEYFALHPELTDNLPPL